jgi:PleD family two-component response regulator
MHRFERHSCGEAVAMKNSGQYPTILIIEDIDWIRSAMKKVIERQGYRAVEATNDAEAFEIAERDSLDLIVTEEEVPTFNALMKRLREHPTLSSVPVVIVDPDADNGARYGDAYLLADYADISSLLVSVRR